jgi:hypothetical protein
MTERAECTPESVRQRHMPKPPAFWNSDVAFPLGALHAQLPLVEINVTPLECHHFATPKSRLTP